MKNGKGLTVNWGIDNMAGKYLFEVSRGHHESN